MRAAQLRLGHAGRDALAAHELVVFLPALAVAWVVLGVHQLEVHAQFEAQAGALDAALDHGGAADQGELGQPFIHHHLGGAQGAFVFAFGVNHMGLALLGGSEHRAHDHAGLVDKTAQGLAVGLQVGDGPRGHAALLGRLSHRRSDAQNQPRIKGLRDDVVGPEAQLLPSVGGGHFVADLGLGQRRNFAHAGQLHFLGDARGAAVQRAPEDVGEAQDVVDLVRVVAAAGGNDAVRAHGLGQLGANLRLGVGQRQDDGLRRHRGHHLGLQNASGRAAEEHIGAVHGIGQAARVGDLAVALLALIEPSALCVIAFALDHALGVDDKNLRPVHAQAHHHIQASNGRRAGAADHQLDAANGLAHQFQRIEHGGAADDGGAVLVVVEDGDGEPLLELLLHIEALGRLDVFEVDAAERRFQRGNVLDELVGVFLVELDVEHIDAGELLEQAAFALHHRLGGQRADVAKAQHGGAVGDDAHQVAACRVLGREARVGLDGEAGVGHAG